ncbi:hypothetical protein ABK040_005611 [Willaertia magna]
MNDLFIGNYQLSTVKNNSLQLIKFYTESQRMAIDFNTLQQKDYLNIPIVKFYFFYNLYKNNNFYKNNKQCIYKTFQLNKNIKIGSYGMIFKLFTIIQNSLQKNNLQYFLNDKNMIKINNDLKIIIKKMNKNNLKITTILYKNKKIIFTNFTNYKLQPTLQNCASFPTHLTEQNLQMIQKELNKLTLQQKLKQNSQQPLQQPLQKNGQPHKQHKKQQINNKREQITTTTNKKVCVFLHGAGPNKVENATHTFNDYWGHIEKYTPQCSERWFIRQNTRDNGWDSDELQRAYCKLSLINSSTNNNNNNNNTLITNTIVFTHSMANLILPAAIHKGYCDFDLTTSSWYSITAPFNGSKAASFLNELCYQQAHHLAPTNEMQRIYDFITKVGDLCDGDKAVAYASSLLPGYCDQNKNNTNGICLGKELYEIVKKRMKGRMCGFSPFGLFTYYGIGLELLSEMVNYGELNDGLVPISSCAMDLDIVNGFENVPNALIYHGDLNHADVTCRNGNSLTSATTKRPCDYYTDKY